MMRFLIVSEEPARLNGLKTGLMKYPQIKIDVVDSVVGAMKEISGVVPSLVIVDEYIAGVSGKEMIETMIKKNPMINTALVSGLTPEDFHEFTEGLGILMQVSGYAGEDVADDMVQKLEKLYSLYK
jgi:DNA-binding NarL/FixJ family response regulator